MKTYRDIFKWGDKREEMLDDGMLNLLISKFNLSNDELENVHLLGNEELNFEHDLIISESVIQQFKNICGDENVYSTKEERASHTYGKHFLELLKLRLGIIDNPLDLVIYPSNSDQIIEIVKICNNNKIPIVPFGGGSSVTMALQATFGGVCLDLSKHFNKVIKINESNCSVTVETGILGPDLEKVLNKQGFTCGHFPQSFEYSTVGGWIAARGAGTLSTGYGKIEEMVLALNVVTPSGIIETKDYPADAQAINLNNIFIGSEGIFGVITEACLKIRKYYPEKTAFASFIFKSFEQAVESMRETMQAGYGKPHLFRISDPDETDIAFKMKGFENTFSDKILKVLGYKPGQRTLMFAAIEGSNKYPEFVKKCLKKTAKKHKGLYIGQKPVKKWLEQRYSSAYARDPIMDKGIITDTFETSVTWEDLLSLWNSARIYLNSRPLIVAMVHISHVYENGANLYFTFLSPWKKGLEVEDYQNFHKGLVDVIVKNKGSLSHHHGIGRILSPWMKEQYGENGISLLQALKQHFDPENIMNPGGMLGLR